MKISLVSSAVVCAVLMVSCGADGPDAAPSDVKPPSEVEAAVTTTIATVPPNGETITIQVLDNSYRPSDYEIKAGTEVVFENRGRNDHNILPESVNGDAELAALLASDMSPTSWGIESTAFTPGDSYTHLFNVPGVYKFYCSIHGAPGAGMYGTLTVS